MKQRFKKVMKPIVILLTIGFLYIILHFITGFSIPCPIYTITGFYCPGCGISRLCFHLARFELLEAASSNVVVFCLLPAFAAGFVLYLYRYIRYDQRGFSKSENAVLIVVIVLLCLFGVIRNILPIDILIP